MILIISHCQYFVIILLMNKMHKYVYVLAGVFFFNNQRLAAQK